MEAPVKMTKGEARAAALRDLHKGAEAAQQMGRESGKQFMHSRQSFPMTSRRWGPRPPLMDDDEQEQAVPDTEGAILELDVKEPHGTHPLYSEFRMLEDAMSKSEDQITKEVFDAAESLFKAAKAGYVNPARAKHRERFSLNVPADNSNANDLDALMLNFNEDLMFQ